jgi:hypothetical protein
VEIRDGSHPANGHPARRSARLISPTGGSVSAELDQSGYPLPGPAGTHEDDTSIFVEVDDPEQARTSARPWMTRHTVVGEIPNSGVSRGIVRFVR